jgi:hypothetical protein
MRADMSIEASDAKRRHKPSRAGTVSTGFVVLVAVAATLIALRIVLVDLFHVL